MEMVKIERRSFRPYHPKFVVQIIIEFGAV
jgi:hypothetical protein